MTVGNRVQAIRKEKKMSRPEFGRRLGVSEDVINNIERDRLSRPDQKDPLLKLICKQYGLSYDWLKYGNGEMYIDQEENEVFDLIDRILDNENPIIKNMFKDLAKLDESEWETVARIIKALKKEST